ncbi:patatin-like phospholipase family protein [Allosphingosinicella deserti]|uniref:RpoH suppressor n=1 Tax=Allosphingosinicella deserti TaxID=2116704 RepID=A0A2P7QH87_9SPHN|nr:patatin-like phospholipase family protein [Sphingomonas deserti]PSJ37303.1 RpoH suppressor [Sphingomonas deserti]
MSTRAPTRYCDLVMKGGITSGIVYPNAVLALSRDFRFKNIGGTSAGAIAAAASAAAAVGDRKKVAGQAVADEARAGFEGLEGVSRTLATQGFIASLFQPASGLRNAYRALVTITGNGGIVRKATAFLFAIFATAPLETLLMLGLFLGVGYAIGQADGVTAALLPALLCAYLGGAIFALLRLARVARRNLLGLCSGLGPANASRPALTVWLHTVLQELSGKPTDDPLTFGDLWNAPRYPDEPVTERAITLQMITTGVSHHEPRTLPFENGGFWFRRDQFDLLFPSEVVAWMVDKAGPPDRIGGIDYHRLPIRADMPVLVAMRMSLSFPLLLSAVPLHEPAARERSRTAGAGSAGTQAGGDEKSLLASTDGLTTSGGAAGTRITAMRICWFSDGGITSNFPIHLFDAPLPLWPTFAINLVYPGSDASAGAGLGGQQSIEESVFLPSENNQGWQRTYHAVGRTLAAAEISRFLFGIVATMQNWRDLLQSRAPGQRDRIVHIELDRSEGGMNLDMPQAVLTRISEKGTAAGERLYDFSFDNHHWIRWRNLASALQRYTIKIAESDANGPKVPAYRRAFDTARTGVPEAPSYRFRTQDRRAAAEALMEELVSRGEAWKDLGPDLSVDAPRPLPQMQIAPTY